ncbi:MAG: PaaI family thioesterase [Alphaproteobacteria bacterium]
MRRTAEVQPFLRHLGVRVVSVDAGTVETVIDGRDALEREGSAFHGGTIATQADMTSGLAALTAADERTEALTVEFKINFLARAEGAQLCCRSQVVRADGTLAVMKADIFSGAAHVATAIVTFLMWKTG